MAGEKLDSFPSVNKTFYIGGREGGAYRQMGIAAMDSIFQLKAPAGLSWKFETYPNETHGSVNFKTMYDGLKFSYSGFGATVRFHPMNGIVVKGKPMKIWNFSETNNLTYTLDGTLPSVNSPKLGQELILEGPAQLNIKLISKLEKYEKIVKGEFKEGNVIPAIQKPKKAKSGGFTFAYFEGEWDKLPDFSKLKPIRTGLTDKNFKISDLPRKNNFAVLIEGLLEVKEDGYYIFGLESGLGSRLYLADQLLIEYTNLLQNDAQTYILPLEKGFYPIKFEHFQKDKEGNLNLVYVTPGGNDAIPIPLENQYSLK